MTSFSKKKKHLSTLTTDQLSGQLFATLALTKLKKIKLTKLKKKPKLWQNSRTQTEIKLKKLIVTKLERSNCDQTQKLKLCKTKKN